jgi:hypothetical protein
MALDFNRIKDELIKDNPLFTYEKLYAQLIDSQRDENINLKSFFEYEGTNHEYLRQNMISRLIVLFNNGLVKPESLKLLIPDFNIAEKLIEENVIDISWYNNYLAESYRKNEESEIYKKLNNNENINISLYQNNRFVTSEWLNNTVLPLIKKKYIKDIKGGCLKNIEINNLLQNGIITELELIDLGYSREEIDKIMGVQAKPFPLGNWDEVPDLLPDRIDVFVLGTPGSGKSLMLAGLLYYIRIEKGGLDLFNQNRSGTLYADQLTDSVENGTIPPRTPEEIIQHISCDIIGSSGNKHPLTFIEMSGEIFRNIYGESLETIEKKSGGIKFKQYLTNNNRKLLFLAIDYAIHQKGIKLNTSQSNNLEYALKFMDENGTLKNTDGICLLIMKWDLSEGEKVKEFLDRKYKNLLNLCESYKSKYKLEFNIYTFSVGNFTETGHYSYDPEYSKKIYEWISNCARIKNTSQKKGFLRKLFGKY